MKIRLTKEESQHLIDLGVPKEKASMTSNQIERGEVYYNDYYQEIFTLTDLLEILPKELSDANTNEPKPTLQMAYIGVENDGYWYGIYENCDKVIVGTESKELIDALYQLTCWYYGEYLKREKK